MRKLIVGLAVLTAIGASAPVRAVATTPNRVVVIVLENEKYSKIVGAKDAPYINSMISAGQLFTDYRAIVSGSLHNYLAMIGGTTVKPKSTQSVPNLYNAMEGANLGWLQLEESMGDTCGKSSGANVPGSSAPLYSRGHDPAFDFRANEDCTHKDVPMTTTTFAPATLPPFTLIVPNQCDDQHTYPSGGDCPSFYGTAHGSSAIAVGDAWLSTVVPQLTAQPDITVILTWDEGSKTDNPPQHIVTVEVGAGVTPGTTDGAIYDHYSLLAGLYAQFGLSNPPGGAASATPLPIP